MIEEEVVKHTRKAPVTIPTLSRDLTNLGVEPGSILLVHSSLSSIGWVVGGAVSVILALENALGPAGTLVMPTFSSYLNDPSEWCKPRVPKSWWNTIRENMPAYDPQLTPSKEMGAIPECFRNQQGVLRSSHPSVSFAARGPKAEEIIKDHSLDYDLGEGSPLGKIYRLNGWVLLLGVYFNTCSSIHLAEYRTIYPRKKEIICGVPVMENGKRVWKEYRDINYDNADFARLGDDFVRDMRDSINIGKVGYAKSYLFRQRLLVDYAVEWIKNHRK